MIEGILLIRAGATRGSEMFCLIEVSGTRRRIPPQRYAFSSRSPGISTTVRSGRVQWQGAERILQGQAEVSGLHQGKQSHTLSKTTRIRAARDVGIEIHPHVKDAEVRSEIALGDLILRLRTCHSCDAKINVLKSTGECRSFLEKHGKWFASLTRESSDTDVFVLLCVVAMGQTHVLVDERTQPATYTQPLLCESLTRNLVKLEKFYNSLGGILGYQLKSLQLLSSNSETDAVEAPEVDYLMPEFLDLSTISHEVKAAVCTGVQAVPFMSEIYALGGSGDRLGLQCPDTGDLLPSAMLPYCGRSMLDSMIRDLQARELLYFRLTGEQHTTPIAIMTSDAKDNDTRIKAMLQSQNWYGRGEDSFRLFKQPLVPLINIATGSWLTSAPGKIVMRPGGHGVIWKLMWDEGVFDWLKSLNREAAVLRQVSNPLASTDNTLFGLCGVGFSQRKTMGFASCERVVGASEGMNVVQHRRVSLAERGEAHEYGITNIEYTEFERLGLTDVAVCDDSSTSRFPANTNILYVSLDAAQKAVDDGMRQGGFGACLPGLIFNTKKRVSYKDELYGESKKCLAGRMECMMQNLADSLVDMSSTELVDEDLMDEHLSTFMVSNVRRKVTSSAKRKYKAGGSIRQTPEGSFWDLLLNARDLLTQCNMEVPEVGSVEEYLNRGPEFIFLFHPALGPLWSIIEQKLKGGRMHRGSEFVLEVAEVHIVNLDLDGSFIVRSENTVGHTVESSSQSSSQTDGHASADHQRLQYSSQVGRIHMENVTVQNEGIDWDHHQNVYWKHQVYRSALCLIQLHGCSEFVAKDVTIKGNHKFDVPDGYQLRLLHDPSCKAGFKEEMAQLPKAKPTWEWRYSIDENEVVVNSPPYS